MSKGCRIVKVIENIPKPLIVAGTGTTLTRTALFRLAAWLPISRCGFSGQDTGIGGNQLF